MNAIGGRRRWRRRPEATAGTSFGASASRTIAIVASPCFSLLAATTSLAFVAATLLVDCCAAFSVVPPSNGNSNNHLPFPHPASAEEVVQNQLHHYQRAALDEAYALCSPGNRDATGSLADYARQLRAPPYDLIVGHARADVLLEVRPDGVPNEESGVVDVACCLVRIRPGRDARRGFPVWFWWEMAKLREDATTLLEGVPDAPGDGGGEGIRGGPRWMVDCIVPDFDDLDFETEALSIEDFLGEDEGGDDDELTIYWDAGE